MNDKFVVATIVVTLASNITAIPISGANFCGPTELCALPPLDMSDAPQRDPAPMQTKFQVVALTTASTSSGTMFTVTGN